MTAALNTLVDPKYVQIQRKQAAQILGVSATEFDRLRKEDPRCPKGHTRGTAKFSRVYFRLSDVYEYSEALMSEGYEATATTGSAGALPPNSR